MIETLNTQATCLPDHCFCESIGDGFPLQPTNSYSSLVFLVFGAALLLYLFRQKRLTKFSFLYTALLFSLGLSSFYYHANLSFLGQTLDVLSMYLLLTIALFRQLWQKKTFSAMQAICGFLFLNAALFGMLVVAPMIRREVFAGLVIFFLAFNFSQLFGKGKEKVALLLALLALVLGYGIWLLDFYRIWCIPGSLAQGHAIWHLLTGLASFLLYFYLEPKK